ncbi:MAG: hypothetical protein V2I48_01950 [Xanthomonadales bacterium]|jgi:hypothetical protein|nr:hypothetical protein [Xanthomonadales bacterium]
MKIRTVLMSVCACLLLGACTSVYVSSPLGDKPVVLDAGWAGVWLTDDGVMESSLVDGEQGLLQLAAIETGPAGPSLETAVVTLREKDGVFYAHVRDDETENLYHWAIVARKSDRLIMAWYPEAKKFKSLISENKFPGSFQKPGDEHNDNVILGELKPEHLEMINDPASGLIDWKNPAVMIRVSE